MAGPGPELRRQLAALPDAPGVYVFRDAASEVIYVGKALSLRHRAPQHFRGPVPYMPFSEHADEAVSVDYIETRNEVEALLLEANLIKQHMPRWNVRLTDDKRYPYIKLSKEAYPRISVVREGLADDAEYFGPYGASYPAKATVRIIQRMLGVRVCRRMNPRGCLYMHIGMCTGPCVGSIGEAAYTERVRHAKLLLRGHTRELREGLEARMRELSAQMRYEEAAEVRDYLEGLERMMEEQSVHLTRERDEDYVAFASVGDVAVVFVLQVRGNAVIDKRHLHLAQGQGLPAAEALAIAIPQLYRGGGVPGRVAVPVALPDAPAIEQALSERAGRKVELAVPARGVPLRLMRLTERNAESAARSEGLRRQHRVEDLGAEQLAQAMGMRRAPRRIEAFDVSHHQGDEAVASMVVFESGRPLKKHYRHFRVRTAAPGDDYAAMREVVGRRYGGTLRASLPPPDLVLIDGGKGQLAAATEAIGGLGERFPVAALAKEREELFLPGRSRPVALAADSDAILLLRRVRDEAHRFAIVFHRRSRRGALTRSSLLELPGIGPVRARELLKHFGSLEAVEAATAEELAKAPGMGEGTARRLWEAMHRER